MNLSGPFIRRPIMTTLTMVAILFFGFVSLKQLPVSDLPNVDYPTIEVSATYPGANPTTMANNVASPLEKKFLTIEGVKWIASQSYTGSTNIVIQFGLNKSMDSAAQDVQAMINQATPQLPEDLPYSPTYSKVNPTATPIIFMSLLSPSLTQAELFEYAQTVVGQRLNIIEGVAQIFTWGAPYAVRVQVDPQKLAAKNIGVDELAYAIQSQNVTFPTGTLVGEKTQFNINVDGQLFDAAQYENLVIRNNEGGVVRLRDVARTLDSLSDDKFSLHYLTKDANIPTIIIGVQPQVGANALAVIDRINEEMPRIKKELPESIEIINIFDKSVYVREAVEEVTLTLFLAALLVVAVIYVLLGKARDTIIPALALPLSVLGTLSILWLLGYNIDILSLLALTLSIGFLVDDAIVVLENIARHVEQGTPPMKAALDGAKEISFTIVSMTLSLTAVFIPMLFMGGIMGRLFTEFAVTIMIAVLFSGFISLSLTPMLCSRFIPPKRAPGRMERFSLALNQKLLNLYEKSLAWFLRFRFLTLLGGLTAVVATLFLLKVLPKDFLPPDDIGVVQGFTQAGDSTSSFQMMEYQEKLTPILQKSPYVSLAISLAGYPASNKGYLYLNLVPLKERPSMQEVVRTLFSETNAIPGLQTFLKPLPLINLDVGAAPAKGSYQFTLQSLNDTDLYAAAPLLLQKVQQLPGFTQVSSDLEITLPQVAIEILRDRAALLDVSAASIEQALALAYARGNLSPINKPDNIYYVIMETLPEFYHNPDALSQLYVRSQTGNLVPLSAVTQMRPDAGPLTVNRINGLPSVTLSFNTDLPLDKALSTLEKTANETLPPSVSGSFLGLAEVFQSSMTRLALLLLITLFVIYIILGVLYENFFHPVTVMSTLAPAALGGLLTLVIFQQSLSLYAFVGIVMLLGIVMKNGIILVDFANSAVEQGKTAEEAIHHACVTRFRPILMTTVAALMGALPIALGIGGLTAQSRRALGLAIVGGLIISQLLTLYLTPVIYLYLEKFKERLFGSPVQDKNNKIDK